MSLAYNTINVCNKKDFILVVYLDRPATKNAMNTEMVLELTDLFNEIKCEKFNLRCLILTSSSGGHFCSGADLKERLDMPSQEWLAHYRNRQLLVETMLNIKIPIIAAVDGPAFGGGCELALACDFIYASENASFALSETRLGIIPGAGGTQLLSRTIGINRAKELIYTGNKLSADLAYKWGLVNKLCSNNCLIADAFDTAITIANNAPISVQAAKSVINKGLDLSLLEGLTVEANAYKTTILTNDRLEGIAAFNERRKANFTGK